MALVNSWGMAIPGSGAATDVVFGNKNPVVVKNVNNFVTGATSRKREIIEHVYWKNIEISVFAVIHSIAVWLNINPIGCLIIKSVPLIQFYQVVYLTHPQKGVYCFGFTHQKTTSHSVLGWFLQNKIYQWDHSPIQYCESGRFTHGVPLPFLRNDLDMHRYHVIDNMGRPIDQ